MRQKLIRAKSQTAVIFAICLVIFIGILIVFNSSVRRVPLRPTGGAQFETATVTKVISSNIEQSKDGELQGNQLVTLRINSGKYKGQTVQAQCPYANNSGAYCTPGLNVIALVNKGSDGALVASVYNYDRSFVLWLLIGVFLAALCIIGGKKGALSSLALVFTFVCIMFLYIPLMYVGTSPFLTASLVSVLITVVTMPLIGGFSRKTLCAILGTIAGVLAAGFTAQLFGWIGHISGVNVTEIETLIHIAQNSKLNVGGILFSGILISSLGAVLDISMSIASTISEIHEANPDFTTRRLFQSGMKVGKDMMGTMSTTLILASAGGSINTLIIIYAYGMSYLQFMNEYAIGIEILSGISGSIGVILTVPFVSFISSLTMSKKKIAQGA